MPRPVSEWIGKSDAHRAPQKVRDRLKQQFPDCYLCSRKIEADEKMALDHVVALINGGENRESNLRPVHQKCHAIKTEADVAEKAKIAKKRQAYHGIKTAPKRPIPSRVEPISQHKAKRMQLDKLPVPAPRQIYVERNP